MFISYSQLVFMLISGSIICFMTVMLFIANYMLQAKNKFLRERLQHQRKQCMLTHVKVPF